MKKVILMLITVILLILSCGNNVKSYDTIENALISILERKNELYISKELDKAMKTSEEEAFILAYLYFGNSRKNIFEKFLNESNGNAEYYKGLLHKKSNMPIEELKELFESAAKQGNEKAYYMLGNIYEKELQISKAQEYYKLGKEKGNIDSLHSYIYIDSLKKEYKRLEILNEKLLLDTINSDEKKELGKIILEKFYNYEKAYEILKPFIYDNYSPALYAKAKILEKNKNFEDAFKIYKNLYFIDNYYLAGLEIAHSIENNEKNYKMSLEVLNTLKVDNSDIDNYKGYLYEKMGELPKAQKYYLKAIKKFNIDAMNNLGKLYENEKRYKKARDIYKKSYNNGSIVGGYNYAILLENNSKKNDNNINYNKEAKKIFQLLSKNGDENSILEFSKYYKDDSLEYKNINIKAAVKLNGEALYNLGVYYYKKGKNKTSKLYLKKSKELFYDIGEEFNEFIKEK